MAELTYQKIIEQMTLEDRIALCSGADFWTTKAFEKYGIPSIRVADGPHGLRKPIGEQNEPGIGKSVPATCFPTASLTACSWDYELLEEIGSALGEEALQEGVSVILGPGANLKRNPLCGRNFEYFSEDPFLSGQMAAGWIKGVQSKGVGVSLKHFAGNNQENERMQSNSIIDERALRELYLSGFELAVRQAQPATIMCAYNLLNGTHCSDNTYLLREILRDEWGFKGVIMTDWGAMNEREKAFEAGLDLEMPGGAGYFDQAVLQAIQEGKLSEEYLNESVDRMLKLIYTAHENLKEGIQYDVKAHHELARKAAAQSAVLLKNEDRLLPLPKNKTIAVIGFLAEKPRYQGAGSSFIVPTYLSNTLEGLNQHQMTYGYYPAYSLKGETQEALLKEAIEGAKKSDLALVFIGLTEDYESEGFDRENMGLPPLHNRLVEEVAKVNPDTVVVLVGGAPVEMPWLSKVKGVLNLYLAGQAGGLAAADLLTGATNPSGKLAETYPLHYEDIPSAGLFETGKKQAQYRESFYSGYRYFDKTKMEVAFPFGFGLSYTSFEYSGLNLSEKEIKEGDEVKVSVNIRNSGEREGAEIVQLYVSDLSKTVYRPEKELKGFKKVFLKAGEEKKISFNLDRRSFAIFDPQTKKWGIPDGEYAILLASSSQDIRLQETLRIQGTKLKISAPDWYIHPGGKPKQEDFEKLLGYKISPVKIPQKGQYSMSSSLRDMQDHFVIRQVIKYLEKTVGESCGGVDYSNPNFRMSMETSLGTPLKSLVSLSSGAMPANLAQGLVHLANGTPLKGIMSILKK